jgi:hypothetical protein
MLYQNPAIRSRVEVGYIWLKRQRVDHLSSCLASCYASFHHAWPPIFLCMKKHDTSLLHGYYMTTGM